MKIIGLSGYARSGKDEAAKVLVDEFGFVRVAFADKLREVLYALDPILPDADFGQGTSAIKYTVQSFIDKFGWSGYKENDGWHVPQAVEVRRLLQRLGTEAGRDTLWDSIWVDAALTGLEPDAKVVVTDVRFPNEYDALKERGGQVWRIKRSGITAFNAHISETALDNHAFDCIVNNDADLGSFRKKIKNAYTYSKLG